MPILLCILFLFYCTASFASEFEQDSDGDDSQVVFTENESDYEQVKDNLREAEFVKKCADSDMTEKQVVELIKNGADINEVNIDGWTALHSAAAHVKDPKVIKLLVKKRLSVHARTVGGFTPLMLAALYNPNPEISKELIRLGSDITATRDSLVFVTDSNGIITIKEKISDRYGDRDGDEKIWGKVDLLQMAVLNNSPQVVSFFLPKEKKLGYAMEKRKIDLIGLAAVKNPKVLSTLLNAGYLAKPNEKSHGRTCAYYDYGGIGGLFGKMALKARSKHSHGSGSQCGLPNTDENVISYALRHNNDVETFKLLLKFKPLVDDETILLTAIESESSVDIIQLLVKAGTPVATKTTEAAINLPLGEYRNKVIDIIAKGKKGRF